MVFFILDYSKNNYKHYIMPSLCALLKLVTINLIGFSINFSLVAPFVNHLLFYPCYTHVKQVKIAKNRHADFWRFLAIFVRFLAIFVRFYGAYCQKIGNPFFFNKSSCRYKNRHIPIFVSL